MQASHKYKLCVIYAAVYVQSGLHSSPFPCPCHSKLLLRVFSVWRDIVKTKSLLFSVCFYLYSNGKDELLGWKVIHLCLARALRYHCWFKSHLFSSPDCPSQYGKGKIAIKLYVRIESRKFYPKLAEASKHLTSTYFLSVMSQNELGNWNRNLGDSC